MEPTWPCCPSTTTSASGRNWTSAGLPAVASSGQADLAEARVGVWALEFLDDPARLADYLSLADQQLTAKSGADVFDPQDARRHLGDLERRRPRVLDMYE
jgi:hypothetical protein